MESLSDDHEAQKEGHGARSVEDDKESYTEEGRDIHSAEEEKIQWSAVL